MSIRKLLVAVSVMPFIAFPAIAQTGSKEGKGGSHHYSGGPKSEVPHHVGPKESSGSKKKAGSGGSHHYFGGPKSEVPHHLGPK